MSIYPTDRKNSMNFNKTTFAAILGASIIAISGCAVTRGQETVGAYVDDAAITSSIKARFIDNRSVDASSIKVETLNGTVMLSGFAKNANEKITAGEIASAVSGVRSVRNEVLVRP